MTKPESGTYFRDGSAVINSAWSVADGESYVIFVNGDLTINKTVTLAGSDTGFVAFIVKGNITISADVGTTSASETPVVEGVYLANGTLTTSLGSAGKERFVGKGIFIANNFTLGRDFGIGQNAITAAELFIYNPEFFMRLPEAMKETSVVWEEIAQTSEVLPPTLCSGDTLAGTMCFAKTSEVSFIPAGDPGLI
jgi:hypothetical protein